MFKGLLRYSVILTIVICLHNTSLLLELRHPDEVLDNWKETSKESTATTVNTSTENGTVADVNYTYYYPPPYHELLSQFKNVSLAIKPTYGVHRPDVDAVMTFTVGYELPQIIYFVTSLIDTGFQGDIVLGMGTNVTDETRDFLSFYSNQHHLIVYNIQLDCCCRKRGSLCKIVNMYQDKVKNVPLMDHRQRRLVAQLRFEYYWAWTTFYSSSSRILLTDARDVFFQLNPFHKLNQRMHTVIHVYEDTEKIKMNTPESNWIRRIYNQTILEQIGHLPGICSGTVLGGKPAIETYNRAMVREWDETSSKNGIGMDQGRHIFLIYMNKLVGAPNITDVISFQMGTGEVYTVGVPLKNLRIPLTEWPGFDGKNNLILNNDGSPSAIVHMFDRHPLLKDIIQNRTDIALLKWRNMRKKGIANRNPQGRYRALN